MKTKCALIMAGGTGGHIFPALALAHALKAQGWIVHWLGSPEGMEKRLVPETEFPFEALNFNGLRGKGLMSWLQLPFKLLAAMARGRTILRRVHPSVVIGFGGFISFPVGFMAKFYHIPLILHEQNSIAGMANKFLAKRARFIFSTFPNVLKNSRWIGNPLRSEFIAQDPPEVRFLHRTGPLKLLVVGGSLGAKQLNEWVPQALSLIPEQERPTVTHQSGEKQLATLESNYQLAKVDATCLPFIKDMATSLAQADVLICRSGASTVSEITAVGVAALFVPFPSAVDDHQTTNAKFLTEKDAAWMYSQKDLNPKIIADFLTQLNRDDLLKKAMAAKKLAKSEATEKMVQACLEVAK